MASRSVHIQRISGAWQKSRAAVFEAGRWLIDAKADLEHGEFEEMIENDLPFSRGTAERLMLVASDRRLRKAAHGPHLPTSWRTLYEITKLSDKQLERGIKKKIIRPDMERKDVEKLRPKPSKRRASDEWDHVTSSIKEAINIATRISDEEGNPADLRSMVSALVAVELKWASITLKRMGQPKPLRIAK